MNPNPEKDHLVIKLIAMGLILLAMLFLVNDVVAAQADPRDVSSGLSYTLVIFGLVINVAKDLVLAFLMFQIAVLFDAKLSFRICFLAILVGALVIAFMNLGESIYMHLFPSADSMTSGLGLRPDLSLARLLSDTSSKLHRILRVFSLTELIWWIIMYLFMRTFVEFTRRQSAYITCILGGLTILVKIVYRASAS